MNDGVASDTEASATPELSSGSALQRPLEPAEIVTELEQRPFSYAELANELDSYVLRDFLSTALTEE